MQTSMTVRVLLIDDDRRLFDLLGSYLSQNGCEVEHAPDGRAGLEAVERSVFDVILLDLMMPGMDGLEVCRKIRAKSTLPLIMLTAKGDETDRVVGLEMGADDYIAKPFGPRELLARIRAVLRRAQPDAVAEKMVAQNVSVDVTKREVVVDGTAVELTGLEFDVLLTLMRRAGRVVPRESLMSEARGDVVVGPRTVDVHISHLRQKLGDDPTKPKLIKTVRGVGYMLVKT
jgi:two-component system, OmpR family, response regulator